MTLCDLYFMIISAAVSRLDWLKAIVKEGKMTKKGWWGGDGDKLSNLRYI